MFKVFIVLFVDAESRSANQMCPLEPIKKPRTLSIQAGAEFASLVRTLGPQQACFDSLSALDVMQTDDRKWFSAAEAV